MNITARQALRMLESRRHPAFLSFVGALVPEADPFELPACLLSLLEPDELSSTSPAEMFHALVERGELGAAEAVLDLSEIERDAAKTELFRGRVSWRQRIEVKRRSVMGLSLVTSTAGAPEHKAIGDAIDTLLADRALEDRRPGVYLRELGAIEQSLNQVLTDLRSGFERELAILETKITLSNENDLRPALAQLKSFISSPETIAQAGSLLQLSRRAAEGSLNADDLRRLHHEAPRKGRLVRPWREMADLGIQTAQDALMLWQKKDPRLTIPDERQFTLVPQLLKELAGSTIQTPIVAKQFADFLGLKLEPAKLSQESFGSRFAFSVGEPRVPAFRDREHFPQGMMLLIPYRPDEGIIHQLLAGTPNKALRLVLFPRRLSILAATGGNQDSVVTIDLIDIMRLAECAREHRLAALQQIMLPRLPLERVKPYQQAGAVAPEMFRGRNNLIEVLKAPRGGTVLFGGRMLGKSSVLSKIHHDYGRQSGVGRSILISNANEDIIPRLVEKLAQILGSEGGEFHRIERKLFNQTPNTRQQRRTRGEQRRQNLQNLLRRVLDSNERLTILIDEADLFAQADAERSRNESIAWMLRDAELEQPTRLRVVFAGFQRIHKQIENVNGAFANWFGLKPVGCLTREEAESLITEPFVDFGFSFGFASPVGIERILQFSGRHPLLVQETCLRLMERMNARRRRYPHGRPGEDEVLTVQAADVEAVCRDPHLKERVRQVLSLNLGENPRLELMVYLLLFASTTAEQDRRVSLQEFDVDDLKSLLVEFYGQRFNEYFDERSIVVAVRELEVLGLLEQRGTRYEFVNTSFANMLLESKGFEDKLQALLSQVTSNERQESRQFVTLPTESFERLTPPLDQTQTADRPREPTPHTLVVSFGDAQRGHIARSIFGRLDSEENGSAILMSGEGCSTAQQLRDKLGRELKERRRSLTLDNLLVQNNVTQFVLTEADGLANELGLGALLDQFSQRGKRIVAFGGAPLARFYVQSLGLREGLSIDVVPLRRLRPDDIKRWGEQTDDHRTVQIVFQDQTSRELHRITGGFYALVKHFWDFRPSPHELFPDLPMLREFEARLTPERVEQLLLEHLGAEQRLLLSSLVKLSEQIGGWCDWPYLESEVLVPLSRSNPSVYDDFDVLVMLDIIERATSRGVVRFRVVELGVLRQCLA